MYQWELQWRCLALLRVEIDGIDRGVEAAHVWPQRVLMVPGIGSHLRLDESD